jgi:hypothetical protein
LRTTAGISPVRVFVGPDDQEGRPPELNRQIAPETRQPGDRGLVGQDRDIDPRLGQPPLETACPLARLFKHGVLP